MPLKVIRDQMVWWKTYKFLLTFNSNYGSILHHLGTATCLSKVVILDTVPVFYDSNDGNTVTA